MFLNVFVMIILILGDAPENVDLIYVKNILCYFTTKLLVLERICIKTNP